MFCKKINNGNTKGKNQKPPEIFLRAKNFFTSESEYTH